MTASPATPTTTPTTPTPPTDDHRPGDIVELIDTPPETTALPAAADLEQTLRAACARIAPLWPLERFVAVNPYLGMSDLPFGDAAERLAAAAGARTTMPAGFYLDQLDRGRIDHADLDAALRASGIDGPDAATWLDRLSSTAATPSAPARVPTVAAVASAVTGDDWERLSTDRISAWAAAYFDGGQAMWRSADRHEPLYRAWRREASIDRTPEVMGLRGFRSTVRSLPDDPVLASDQVIGQLGIPTDALEPYLHALLLRVGGWAAYTAQTVWDRGLLGEDDDTLQQFLAVLLGWELAILRAGERHGVPAAWGEAVAGLPSLAPAAARPEPLAQELVLQDAFDRSAQRHLVEQLAHHEVAVAPPGRRPQVQAVFCIDVRSEVLRRHLEHTADDVDTLGFAGFFGFPIDYVPIGHDRGNAQCPVLLTPGATVAETAGDPDRTHDAARARRLRHHVRRAWKSFKMGAISCFSFVGPVGLIYLPKLFTDSRGTTRPVARPEDEALPGWTLGHLGPGIDAADTVGLDPADRVDLAEGALRGMSLTDGFAPLVAIVGHGAATVNNPYATGLHCGACGGNTGEANARVAASVLNDPDVRAALAARGICIPDDTWFVAGLHNTTTDEVTLFDRALVPSAVATLLAELDGHLAEAGRRARAERARRFGLTDHEHLDEAVVGRSTDWAQVRPEWGLAGCQAFIAAPRSRTRGLDLRGRSFLHSYDWRQDEGFRVLAQIMTAPMVVASWISLQYYASTVDNRVFGSGNKTLHNVVGRIGVLEGNGGDLRTGLPWQSVHDGEQLQHEPLRLAVIIEAPTEAMSDVLDANPSVRDLCDNGWLQLLAMDETGSVSHRYLGGGRWEPIPA